MAAELACADSWRVRTTGGDSLVQTDTTGPETCPACRCRSSRKQVGTCHPVASAVHRSRVGRPGASVMEGRNGLLATTGPRARFGRALRCATVAGAGESSTIAQRLCGWESAVRTHNYQAPRAQSGSADAATGAPGRRPARRRGRARFRQRILTTPSSPALAAVLRDAAPRQCICRVHFWRNRWQVLDSVRQIESVTGKQRGADPSGELPAGQRRPDTWQSRCDTLPSVNLPG